MKALSDPLIERSRRLRQDVEREIGRASIACQRIEAIQRLMADVVAAASPGSAARGRKPYAPGRVRSGVRRTGGGATADPARRRGLRGVGADPGGHGKSPLQA